jgi:hypothetical protein
MRRKLILVSLILLGITSRAGLCQADHGHSVNIIYSESLLSGELFDPASTPDISTYFNKEWLSGDIRLMDGRIIRNKKIKYNGLIDELFWLEPVSNLTIKLDKESINQFHFLNFQGDTTIRFIKIKIKQDIFTDSIEIFSQEIKKGNLSLLISHHYYFAGKEAVRMNKSLYLKEIYKEEPVYYLRFPNNRIIEFKRFSRKNLFASIPDKKDLIRQYFRESISGKIRTDQEILDFVLFLSSFDY